MDSKHFPSRSTTDNLPSSLSTPGERAGLSGPSAPVDAQSVATTSSSTNTITSQLPSGCSSSVTEISPSLPIATANDSESDTANSRLPPVVASDSSEDSTTCSDKTFDPIVCSSSSCSSSLASSISAAISSSSMGHNTMDESEFQAKNITSAVTSSLIQTGPDHASVVTYSGQSKQTDSSLDAKTITVTTTNISKSTESNEEQLNVIQKPIILNSNAKSFPSTSNNQTQDCSSLLKDKSTTIDVSSEASPSRGIKRKHVEIESTSDVAPSPEPSPQKNKKRCFVCSCKLELAQRTIGKCRCDRIFCPVHRLPELHDCKFNHKEDGRREARDKMVKPTRHMGTSFRRDDHS